MRFFTSVGVRFSVSIKNFGQYKIFPSQNISWYANFLRIKIFSGLFYNYQCLSMLLYFKYII